MYKVPKSLTHIDVLGREIPVKISNKTCKAHNAMGLYVNGTIVLRSKYQSDEDFMDTLAHEAFHALCETLGTQLDIQLEEILANTSARLFLELIKTMSNLYIMEEVEDHQEMSDISPSVAKVSDI